MSESTVFPDLTVGRGGYRFTVRTTFDAARGCWETRVLDLTGLHTGDRLGQLVIGGSPSVSYTAEAAEQTRKGFCGIIRRFDPR